MAAGKAPARRAAAAKATPAKTTPKASQRAAIAEVVDEPRIVEAFGLTLEVPAELPFAVLRSARKPEGLEQVADMLVAILGEAQAEEVWAAGLSITNGMKLVELVFEEMGLTPGESSASATS